MADVTFTTKEQQGSTHLVVLDKVCYYAAAPGLTCKNVARRFAEEKGSEVKDGYKIATIRRVDNPQSINFFAYASWMFDWDADLG